MRNLKDLRYCKESVEKLITPSGYKELSVRVVEIKSADNAWVHPEHPTGDLYFRPQKLINGSRMKMRLKILEDHMAATAAPDYKEFDKEMKKFDEMEDIVFDYN